MKNEMSGQMYGTDSVKQSFSKETYELWYPYLSSLDESDWYLESADMGWYLKTPFYVCSNFESDNHKDMKRYVSTAQHKMNEYHRIVCNKDSDINSIYTAICFVEKWKRETYLLRYLQTFNIERFGDDEIWELISDIWSNNEFPCHSYVARTAWKKIFKIRPRPKSLVSHLPDVMTVYRGGHPEGYAWTSSKKTAEEFHQRNSLWSFEDDQNFLCQRTITRDEVAFTDGSDLDVDYCENEIVLFPHTDWSKNIILKDNLSRR